MPPRSPQPRRQNIRTSPNTRGASSSQEYVGTAAQVMTQTAADATENSPSPSPCPPPSSSSSSRITRVLEPLLSPSLPSSPSSLSAPSASHQQSAHSATRASFIKASSAAAQPQLPLPFTHPRPSNCPRLNLGQQPSTSTPGTFIPHLLPPTATPYARRWRSLLRLSTPSSSTTTSSPFLHSLSSFAPLSVDDFVAQPSPNVALSWLDERYRGSSNPAT